MTSNISADPWPAAPWHLCRRLKGKKWETVAIVFGTCMADAEDAARFAGFSGFGWDEGSFHIERPDIATKKNWTRYTPDFREIPHDRFGVDLFKWRSRRKETRHIHEDFAGFFHSYEHFIPPLVAEQLRADEATLCA